MTDQQILHPVLGRSVKNGATDTCSKCGHSIPEDHVPLIMWDETGNLMWVFCDKPACEGPIFNLVATRGQPGGRGGVRPI